MTMRGWENYRPPSLSETETTREKRSNKYGARKTTVDGQTFDSAKEARRYTELKMREKAGEIHDLQRQVPYPLKVNGMLVATYVADAVYCDCTDGQCTNALTVEDTKSSVTRKLPVYRLKFKLMQAIHGVTIKEV